MIAFVFILVGLMLIVLQTSVLMVNPVWVASPDLYYILIAYLAYRFDLLRSLIILFPLSWIMDVFSGVVIGTYPAICFGAFVLLKVIDAKIPVRESLYQVPLMGVSYLIVYKVVHTFFSFFLPGSIAPWSWPEMFVKVFLLVLVAFPLFGFFEYINQRLQKKFVPFKMLRVRSGNRFRFEDDER
jgi:rod shape-determining protein MreD